MRKRRRWLGLLPQPGWASLISACYICKLSYSVGSNSWKEIIKFISNVQTWVWASHIFPLQIHNQCFIFMEWILLSILKILVVSDHLGSDVPKGWIWLFRTCGTMELWDQRTLGPRDHIDFGTLLLWTIGPRQFLIIVQLDSLTCDFETMGTWDLSNRGICDFGPWDNGY